MLFSEDIELNKWWGGGSKEDTGELFSGGICGGIWYRVLGNVDSNGLHHFRDVCLRENKHEHTNKKKISPLSHPFTSQHNPAPC